MDKGFLTSFLCVCVCVCVLFFLFYFFKISLLYSIFNACSIVSLLLCVDVQRLARIDSEVVIVPKVSVEAVNVLVLLQAGNAILMFAEIAGLGEHSY